MSSLAIAGSDEDLAESVARCARRPTLTSALVEFTSSPKDAVRFTALFNLVNDRLVAAIERNHHLGGDDAMEVAQIILQKIWEGKYRWEGDSSWSDSRAFSWIAGYAKFELLNFRQALQGKSVHTTNMAADSAHEDFDFMGAVETSTHGDEVLTQAIVNLLTNRLQRFVLTRQLTGKTNHEIAEELGRSVRTVQVVAKEGKESITEILKGRDPVLHLSPLEPEMMRAVEDALDRDLLLRPIRAPEHSIRLTKAELTSYLMRSGSETKEIVRRYFIEGQRRIKIAQELGVTERKVDGAVNVVIDAVSREKLRGDIPKVDQIIIVNEQGVPLTRHRQVDWALETSHPIDIQGTDFFEAIKDWNLRAQQVMQMRYVEGLSASYISEVLGVSRADVDWIFENGIARVHKLTGEPVSIADMRVVGDVSVIHTSPLTISAEYYLRLLEKGQDHSEEAKLKLAKLVTGVNVLSLPRIVLIDNQGRPIANDRQSHWVDPPLEPVQNVNSGDLSVVLTRLSAEDGRLLNLHLRGRWSYSTLATYFKITEDQVNAALDRGRYALSKELGDPKLFLNQVHVLENTNAPKTLQVNGEEFKGKFSELSDTSISSVLEMISRWKRRKLDAIDHLELLGTDGRPLFLAKQTAFTAAPPRTPVNLLISDFEGILERETFSEQEKKVLRMRFQDRWGNAGISYLMDLDSQRVTKILSRGMKAIFENTNQRVDVRDLALIPDGNPNLIPSWRSP